MVLYRFNSRDLAEQAVQQFRAGDSLDEVNESLRLYPLTNPEARQLGRYFQELQLTRPLWRRLTGDARFDELLDLQDGQLSRVYDGVGNRFFVVWKRADLGELRFEAARARARMELLDEAAQRLVEDTLAAGDRTSRDSVE